MSVSYQGLIVELAANTTIPDKNLESIMTAYPSCWGYAAPVTDKKGNKKLLTAATKIPEGWSAKDIRDMKAELQGTPEMIEFFGKFPDNTDDVCMQPFPVLEDDQGNVTLAVLLEGEFDHWSRPEEPNLSPEYICYRDKITPLVNKLHKLIGGDLSKLVKELGSAEFQEVFEGTFGERGVIYFIANNGATQMIEGGNDKRKDMDWGALSNEVPEVQAVTDPVVEEEQPQMSLAEKRAARQKQKTHPPGVHTTEATPRPVMSTQNTTMSEQRVKDTLKDTAAATQVVAKGPFLITLPSTIRTEDEAKSYWRTNFGTCPDNWKVKQANGSWLPSYTAGFPYEKLSKGSVLRDKYNADGSLRTTGKGFAALDDLATGKGNAALAAETKSAAEHETRPPTAPSKLPIIPTAVRDKVIEEIVKLDLKARPILPNEEIKNVEERLATVYQQLKNWDVQDTWKMTYEERDRLIRTYPDFASVWLTALLIFQKNNWKEAAPKQEETAPSREAVQAQQEMTLAEKRAARKKAANG